VFIYSSLGKWAFPPLLSSFPLTTAFTSFPAPGCCWACATAPAFSGWLVYLQFHEGFPLLLFSAQGTLPSLLCVFYYCLLFSFSFFPQWGLVCPGGYAYLAQGFCGSTTCHLAHLEVCIFPSGLGAGIWRQLGSSPGFSI
jgi:hypothetical protein